MYDELILLYLLVSSNPVVLNSSPRDPLFCILCMSPLFKKPDSDPQFVRINSMN